MNNFFDTISNFIEGEQNFGNLGFIINLLYNIEYGKEPKITKFNKKGCFDFAFKEFSYDLNLDSLKVSLRKLEINGLNIDIDISSFSKEPKEKIILEAKDINVQRNDDELTVKFLLYR
jgi:hypothetical protein